MKSTAPWSVKGIERDARERAKDAARREGVTLGEWLNRVIYVVGEEDKGLSVLEGDALSEAAKIRDLAAAIARVPDDATHIAVHDAARAITPGAVIDRVFDAAKSFPAVVPGIPVADTLKRTDPEPVEAPAADPLAAILAPGGQAPSARVITDTVDRAHLFAVQTPQVFDAALLRRAYAQDGFESATDDAALVERLGERVVIVPGDPANMKLTRREDLPVIRALGGFKPPAERATHMKF